MIIYCKICEKWYIELNNKFIIVYEIGGVYIMNAIELRKRYINFFEDHGHKAIPSAPVVPENDPTVLFTTAGMHPLVP